MLLKGKVTLITGASAGIGKSCAEVFAESGSSLILVARRKNIIDDLAKELKYKYMIDSICIECDVRKSDQVKSSIDALPENWKLIDILINNAGLSRGIDKIQNGNTEDWDETIDTNIKGFLYVTNSVLPGMVSRGSGMIINMASVAGRQVYAGGNVYCASKAAIRTLSQSMQLDLNGTGVRIANIDPGMVETEFSLVRFKGDADRANMVYKGWTPLTGRDVAEVALFCATRPPHVSIHDILIMATDQASTGLINKKM